LTSWHLINQVQSKTSPAHIKRQNNRVISLLKVLDAHISLSVTSMPLTNIVTEQVYSNEISDSLLSFEDVGNEKYVEFVDERLKSDSQRSILDPIKKVNLNNFKSAIKSRKIKIDDKTKELRVICNLFARCALLKGQRNIDMKQIVGDLELTIVPRSLFATDGSLLDGSKSKSDAVTEILRAVDIGPIEQLLSNPTCVAINSMRVLNEIQSKHLKTGQDLVTEFLRRVDSITVHANVKVIVFDTYDTTQSLKDKTRISRKRQIPVPPETLSYHWKPILKRFGWTSCLPVNQPNTQ
jgi:hypothetical protein